MRELENILERGLSLAADPQQITAEDLHLTPVADERDAAMPPGEKWPLQDYLDRVERAAINEALEKTRFNRTAAAKLLGITFRAMRYRMERLGFLDMTRKIQDEAAATFESLFLGGKGDALPPVEALGLFYDFRELTPIGRRGDEMIRRLSDRLVGVDLLDQAAELLQHQVDHRLQGAARAQVATRLTVVYLMNRKPDRALATLQATRVADLVK